MRDPSGPSSLRSIHVLLIESAEEVRIDIDRSGEMSQHYSAGYLQGIADAWQAAAAHIDKNYLGDKGTA